HRIKSHTLRGPSTQYHVTSSYPLPTATIWHPPLPTARSASRSSAGPRWRHDARRSGRTARRTRWRRTRNDGLRDERRGQAEELWRVAAPARADPPSGAPPDRAGARPRRGERGVRGDRAEAPRQRDE